MSGINIIEDSCIDDSDSKIIKLIWRIPLDYTIISPLFKTSAPDTLGNWRISLDQYVGYSSVRIFQENSTVEPTHVIFYFFHDNSQKPLRLVCNCDRGEYCAKFKIKGYYNCRQNGGYSVLCEIVIRVPSEKSPSKFVPPPSQLGEDLGNLLSSKTLSDVTIVVGGEKLRAHKAVLAARSAVFAAMFSNDMQEKNTSVVEVVDMDAEVFQAMLKFMYTGKEISLKSRAHDLLAAADKYQLQGLKLMCEKALSKALSLNNVLESLVLADLHNSHILKEQCIRIINLRRHMVLRTSSWKKLKRSHQSLVIEVLEKISLDN